jgi:hypothetical protein
MRYAILHCRACLNHVWVPEDRMGQTGRCPDCGALVATPAEWPEASIIEGPHVMHEFPQEEAVIAGAGIR